MLAVADHDLADLFHAALVDEHLSDRRLPDNIGTFRTKP